MSEGQDHFLNHRIREEWRWMQDNYDEEVTEQDALDHLLQECGATADGDCLQAGSEYCDWECPFHADLGAADEDDDEAGEGG